MGKRHFGPPLSNCSLFLSAAFRAAMTDREKRVEASLRSGKTADAARISLENPPFASKDEAIKEKNAAIVLKAVVAVGSKEADLTDFLSRLDLDLADALMKYIVRGLRTPENAGLLFKIHAALVEKLGTGSIVRAIVDRKTA